MHASVAPTKNEASHVFMFLLRDLNVFAENLNREKRANELTYVSNLLQPIQLPDRGVGPLAAHDWDHQVTGFGIERFGVDGVFLRSRWKSGVPAHRPAVLEHHLDQAAARRGRIVQLGIADNVDALHGSPDLWLRHMLARVGVVN